MKKIKLQAGQEVQDVKGNIYKIEEGDILFEQKSPEQIETLLLRKYPNIPIRVYGNRVILSAEEPYKVNGKDIVSYNSWESDPNEKYYIMGVEKSFADFLDSHDLYAEWIDGGTMGIYNI